MTAAESPRTPSYRSPRASRGALMAARQRLSSELTAFAAAARARLAALDDDDAEPHAETA